MRIKFILKKNPHDVDIHLSSRTWTIRHQLYRMYDMAETEIFVRETAQIQQKDKRIKACHDKLKKVNERLCAIEYRGVDDNLIN